LLGAVRSHAVLPTGTFEVAAGSVHGIGQLRIHDLRHTFASWYMMNGGDLYELAKILGHSNIKMTERYAKLGQKHIARTGNTAREIWKLMEQEEAEQTNVV
jgi:integrase